MATQNTQNKVAIVINGKTLDFWTEATINAGVERMPRTFTIGVTMASNFDTSWQDVFPRSAAGSAIQQPMKITLNGTTVLTGYIVSVDDELTGDTHTITISGAGVCQDVVECSTSFYDPSKQQNVLTGVSFASAVQALVAEYDIKVICQSPLATSIFNGSLPIHVGDDSYTAVELFARMSSSLLYEDAYGNLVLGVPGSAPRSLTLLTHQKVIRSRVVTDTSKLMSTYNVFSHFLANNLEGIPNLVNKPASYTDNTFKNRVTAQTGKPRVRTSNKIVEFFNPLLTQDTTGGQQYYANFYGNRVNGRAQSVDIEVMGWFDDQGQLWQPNQYVSVTLPKQYFCGQNATPIDMIVTECQYSINPGENGGTVTRMSLMLPTGLGVEPTSLVGLKADEMAQIRAAQDATGSRVGAQGSNGMLGSI